MNIVILTSDQELALLRKHALESAGHQAIAISTEKEAVEAAEKNTPFDVALVCHRLPAATSRKIIRMCREKKHTGKFVFIAHVYGEWPEVEADRYVVGADGPDALLRVIEECAPQHASRLTAEAS